MTDVTQWRFGTGQEARANRVTAVNNIRLVVLPDAPTVPTYLPVPTAGADSLTPKRYAVFGRLDISQVPTGYLAEASIPFLNARHYS